MAGGAWRRATTVSRLPRLSVTSVVLCAAVIAILYLGVMTARYALRNYQLNREEAQLRSDLRLLDAEHEELTRVRTYLDSDSYVELIARRVLGLVRPGESLAIVHGPDAPAPADDGEPEAGERWWERLFVPEEE